MIGFVCANWADTEVISFVWLVFIGVALTALILPATASVAIKDVAKFTILFDLLLRKPLEEFSIICASVGQLIIQGITSPKVLGIS
jgi:hypothetical protein